MAKQYLITGGAGFIGSNYVYRLLSRQENVTILDNLSRPGARKNIAWLIECFGRDSFKFVEGDVCDAAQMNVVCRDVDAILHLAGQVAVTTSVRQPRLDFEQNAIGTFNVLEAARLSGRQPVFIYASTNKVYGRMEDVGVLEQASRYVYAKLPNGVPETHPLDFHSPYGCSKGCGDQYTRDYARIYGLPTVVLRQSCIYGPRQFGIEDQGWIAWFIIAVLTGKTITIFGNGKQVRDILFINDLMDAYDMTFENIAQVNGQVYNIGGGTQNTLSVWLEFCPILERLFQRTIPVTWDDWRPGDQPVYISDIHKIGKDLKWQPKVGIEEGITRLYQWVIYHRHIFE
jgi:CDP-paratose 2-epimerase